MVTAGVYLVARMSADLPAGARGLGGDRRRRRGHRVLRRHDRLRADRHQEGARLLDRVAARLHVRWRSAWAPTAWRSSTSSRTRSSRPACSSAPAA